MIDLSHVFPWSFVNSIDMERVLVDHDITVQLELCWVEVVPCRLIPVLASYQKLPFHNAWVPDLLFMDLHALVMQKVRNHESPVLVFWDCCVQLCIPPQNFSRFVDELVIVFIWGLLRDIQILDVEQGVFFSADSVVWGNWVLDHFNLDFGCWRAEGKGPLVMHFIIFHCELVSCEYFEGPPIHIQQLVRKYFTFVNEFFLRSLARLSQSEAFGQLFPPQHKRKFIASWVGSLVLQDFNGVISEIVVDDVGLFTLCIKSEDPPVVV